MEQKEAEKVSVLLLNPQNGEIYACVNVPEFDLNDPYTLPESVTVSDRKERTDALNRMWRNTCINDTYEPGSTFKIITASAGLEAGVVTLQDQFSCPGFRVVEDRRIHCARRTGHGAQTFVQGIENSCNPVFIDVALRLGVEKYYDYFQKFGLLEKTGIDLPGDYRIRSVIPDYSSAAGNDSRLSDQRWGEDHTPFRSKGAKPGWKGHKNVFI